MRAMRARAGRPGLIKKKEELAGGGERRERRVAVRLAWWARMSCFRGEAGVSNRGGRGGGWCWLQLEKAFVQSKSSQSSSERSCLFGSSPAAEARWECRAEPSDDGPIKLAWPGQRVQSSTGTDCAECTERTACSAAQRDPSCRA